jgi:hypothetical protein
LDAAPCISRLKPAKFGRRVSAVRCGSEARPKEEYVEFNIFLFM